jgi:hypothetical protein
MVLLDIIRSHAFFVQEPGEQVILVVDETNAVRLRCPHGLMAVGARPNDEIGEHRAPPN